MIDNDIVTALELLEGINDKCREHGYEWADTLNGYPWIATQVTLAKARYIQENGLTGPEDFGVWKSTGFDQHLFNKALSEGYLAKAHTHATVYDKKRLQALWEAFSDTLPDEYVNNAYAELSGYIWNPNPAPIDYTGTNDPVEEPSLSVEEACAILKNTTEEDAERLREWMNAGEAEDADGYAWIASMPFEEMRDYISDKVREWDNELTEGLVLELKQKQEN